MADTLADVKYQVAVANRVLWAVGRATGVTASLGHASLRVGPPPSLASGTSAPSWMVAIWPSPISWSPLALPPPDLLSWGDARMLRDGRGRARPSPGSTSSMRHLLIGLGTLEQLAASPDPLDPARRVKLSRGAVRGILARSALTVWSNRSLAGDAARWRRRIAV